MKWTTDKPKKNGYYWVKYRNKKHIVAVFDKATKFSYQSEHYSVTDTFDSVKWSDQPIPEPQTQEHAQ